MNADDECQKCTKAFSKCRTCVRLQRASTQDREVSDTHTIKNIIFWLRQIDEYKKVIRFIDGHSNTKGVIVSKETTFLARIKAHNTCHEIELDETATLGIYNYFKNYISHLEKLVDEADPNLVEIAKGIYNGELNKNGFDFVW